MCLGGLAAGQSTNLLRVCVERARRGCPGWTGQGRGKGCLNRRELFRTTVAGAAGMTLGSAEQRKDASAVQSRTKPPIEAALSDKEIYGLLGFATMTGEDPLRMWARLQATKQWLAGPPGADAWPGQVFVADHGDIFAFRFLSLPAGWMAPSQDNQRAAYYAKQWPSWWRHWPEWWRRVGPRAWDDSYARLIWQMPDGGARGDLRMGSH